MNKKITIISPGESTTLKDYILSHSSEIKPLIDREEIDKTDFDEILKNEMQKLEENSNLKYTLKNTKFYNTERKL